MSINKLDNGQIGCEICGSATDSLSGLCTRCDSWNTVMWLAEHGCVLEYADAVLEFYAEYGKKPKLKT